MSVKQQAQKITSFSDIQTSSFYSFDEEITKCKYIYSNSIIYLDSTKEYSKNQSEFNVTLFNNCRALTLAVIWYLATNKVEKYIVDENTQIVEAKTHHKSKHINHTRNIKTPIYDLVDNRTTTVERLIKKRNGWTISHSFQVRGHYRHYKNGKTIFIKSFEKGKGLDNFQSVNIILSPEEKL